MPKRKSSPKQRRPARAGGALDPRGRPLRLVLLAIIVLLVVAFFLARMPGLRHRVTGGGRPRVEAAPLNVLLITLDTTRADHLGCYGYARARTRHLDELAREGVRFDRAYSPAPITLPAHASILTGLYPFAHGVRNNGNFYLGDRFDTLATILRARGYRTAAFISSFILDRRYGLARGFEVYDDRQEGAEPQVISFEAERRGDRTALALSRWLEQYAAGNLPPPAALRPADAGQNPEARSQNPEGLASHETARRPTQQIAPRSDGARRAPFFVWLHLYDPHEPYHAPPPFGPAFADSPYDGEIAFDDAVVASIMDKLGALGLRDGTLVVIVGDHGESLGDHGEETHTMFVYEAAIRVPFIVWKPGLVPSGRVVDDIVQLTDVTPTVLELAGSPPLKTADGLSLVPLLDGRPGTAAPLAYAETLLPELYMNWAPLRAVRDDRWKFIDAPKPELYDLASDPGEQQNRYEERPQTARSLRDQLMRLTGGAPGEMSFGRMDRETIEKLAALGYVGAGGGAGPAEPAVSRADPKDFIALYNRLRRANTAVRERRFDEALPVLREVVEKDPRNAFAQLVLGSAYLGMNENRRALEQYRKYAALVPASAYAHLWMAICHVRLRDQQAALHEAEAALAIDPRFSDAHILRGGVFASRGQYDAAIKELRTAVETDPAKPMIRLDLAKVLAESGRTEEAQTEYDTILRLQPDYAPALTGAATVYAKRGDRVRAANLLQRALEIDPAQDEARFNLAQVLEQQGRPAEARAEYQRLADSAETPPDIRAAARERLRKLRQSR